MSRRTVLAFGSFDVIHPGHIRYLKGASRYGQLIVVVARDRSMEMLKGKTPLMDERSRVEIVGSLRFVWKAVLGGRIRKWNDIYKTLLKFRPDVIALGYDQKVDMGYLKRFLDENGLNARIVRIKPFKHMKFKSSMLKKMMESY